MYGARSKPDLAVTRFYAPLHVYQIMKRIHNFDAALREAFESGAHDSGVYFIRKDPSNRLIPCSPNKLLFSDLVSIRPGKRLVLSGFQTVSKSKGEAHLKQLDELLAKTVRKDDETMVVDARFALTLLQLAFRNLEFDDSGDDDRKAHLAALEHLSKTSGKLALKGKVLLLTARDRNVTKYHEEGRFSNAPDTKQQKDLARARAEEIPVLVMLRQNGREEDGWRGMPFWWPVIVTPMSAPTAIFASEEAASPTAKSGGADRTLQTDEIG